MSDHAKWLFDLDAPLIGQSVEGLVPVAGYKNQGRSPEEVSMMEKASAYGAHSVFFEAGRNGGAPVAQAFVFVSDGPADDKRFGELHQRLWSWAGVPLLYRKTPGIVQLFRCAHKPDFISATGETICKPYKTLRLAAAISDDPWWDAARLRNGTLWDDPVVCKEMLSAGKAAHKRLIDAVKQLNNFLNTEGILKKHLRRKLLILSLLIAYLEERGVLLPDYFSQFSRKATKFFQVLANGESLIKLLAALEERFNGNVFTLNEADRDSLRSNGQLSRFAKLIEGREELNGQLTLWQLYSFRDLPVEVISHIYQLFVTDSDSSIYTPPFMVRLMLDEALSWSRLDRLQQNNEIILDPSCGSGVFLVEAYKRLVLHWRSKNEWKRPGVTTLKGLLKKVHGIDLEEGAVELAAFSLCLALCDALEPETIRASIKLFPLLAGKTLHHSCFFAAKEAGLIKEPIGVVTGNPPFSSALSTPGALRSYARYESEHGSLPDKQVAYLFLHESMEMVASGGVLSMLQQYNFLYNQLSLNFRRAFISTWDVREILDFISVRGLFQKGGADTKVVVILAEASSPPEDRQILHATFRRSGRVDAEQGFDIDYYDLHWLSRSLTLSNDSVWRTNLLGGGRSLGFVNRLREYRTLADYAETHQWEHGEGFIYGNPNDSRPASHVVGKPFFHTEALTSDVDQDLFVMSKVPKKNIQWPRRKAIYTSPVLLIHKHIDLNHRVWRDGYITYSHEIFGVSAAKGGARELEDLSAWMSREGRALQAYTACISPTILTAKATAILSADILSLPCPETGGLDLSDNERIIIDDILDYQRDLVRLGEDSQAMKANGLSAISQFNQVFTKQLNGIYKKNALQALEPQSWPGIICQPFVFGKGKIDWADAEALHTKLNTLLQEQRGTTLHVTRIARIYDGNFVFLLKPDRLRYWLRSTALRDVDETLSDLRAQGF